MPRKIYDIKPPKVAHKTERKIKEFLEEGKKDVSEKKVYTSTSRRKKEKRSMAGIWVACSVAVVLLICGYLYFALPKVDVKIWPKVETLSFQQTITADKTVQAVDISKTVIPAQYFETTKEVSEDFPATGNADNSGRASGVITVFNKCSPSAPLTLAKGAHFLSNSGKTFSYLQKFTIPAATKKGPGSVKITVTAAAGGADSNIPPAAFSIPKLNGTIYFSCIYATSDIAMTGGFDGKVKKVTDDDIQGAKDVLTKKLNEEVKKDLKSKISSDYVLLDNAISTNIVSASTQTKAGTIVQNFTYQESVKASALVFKKSDLEEYAKEYIISQMAEGKTLLDKTLKTDYSAVTVDITGGKISLNYSFSSDSYQSVDKNSLTISLMGENSSQITNTINSNLGDSVENIKVNFWPFWVKNAPTNQKKINLILQFK